MVDYMKKIRDIPADSFTEAMKEHYGNDDEIFEKINGKADKRAKHRMEKECQTDNFDTKAFAIGFLRFASSIFILFSIAAFAAAGHTVLAIIPSVAFITGFVASAFESGNVRWKKR